MSVETILSYQISTKSIQDCINEIVGWVNREGEQKYLVCANPHSLEVAQTDLMFEKAIKSADLVIPDGIGVVLASEILGGNIRKRVTGSDIFLGLSKELNKKMNCSYFFLGSSTENLAAIELKMKTEFPNIVIAGTHAPPFKSDFTSGEIKTMIDAVNKAQPDVLWVGMTAPKQEKWIYSHRGKLQVKFIAAVGAVFDFYTGRVRRSHPVFQRMGLEWLPRLLRQPGRLWRRNFISNPRFLLRVIKSRFLFHA